MQLDTLRLQQRRCLSSVSPWRRRRRCACGGRVGAVKPRLPGAAAHISGVFGAGEECLWERRRVLGPLYEGPVVVVVVIAALFSRAGQEDALRGVAVAGRLAGTRATPWGRREARGPLPPPGRGVSVLSQVPLEEGPWEGTSDKWSSYKGKFQLPSLSARQRKAFQFRRSLSPPPEVPPLRLIRTAPRRAADT